MTEISLNAEYYPDVDMFVIRMPSERAQEAGHQAGDPDVVMHKDTEGRIVEIEIEHASKRVSPAVLEAAKRPREKVRR